MKKSFLVLALGILALNASAETRKEVRVEFKEYATKSGEKMLGMKLAKLFIEVDGVVHRSDCPLGLELPCNTTVVAKLNATQMDQIENLINDAETQNNVLVRSKTSARCIMAATKERAVSADHGKLKLYKGDICSAIFESSTEAGKKLTAIVAELVRKTTPKN